jgi:hypothetical protein
MRGGGGIGATGRAAIGPEADGALTEITGVVAAAGVCTEAGTTERIGCALTGDDALGGATTDGEEDWKGACDGTRGGTGGTATGAAGPTLTGAAGGATIGLVTGGATTGRLTPAGGATTEG